MSRRPLYPGQISKRRPYRYRSAGSFTWGWIAAAVLIIAFFVAATQIGRLASQKNAENTLRTQGFTNIHLVKRHIYFVQIQGCGHEDVARFDFKATNPRGVSVSVQVCEGWPFKGATVRGT